MVIIYVRYRNQADLIVYIVQDKNSAHSARKQEMGNYAELLHALEDFRELYRRRILPNSSIIKHPEFMQSLCSGPDSWANVEVSTVYWFIKPQGARLRMTPLPGSQWDGSV
jgi:hypothetical protein